MAQARPPGASKGDGLQASFGQGFGAVACQLGSDFGNAG